MFGFQRRPALSKWPSTLLWKNGSYTDTSPLLWVRCWVFVWGLKFPSACQMDRDPYISNQETFALTLSEGKYICHSYCRDLVHLDYPQNGKLPSCMPTCEVRHSSQKNPQVGATWCLQCSGLGAVPSLECQENGEWAPYPHGLPVFLHKF